MTKMKLDATLCTFPVDLFNTPRDVREGRVRWPEVGEAIRIPHAAPGTGYSYYVVVGTNLDTGGVLVSRVSKDVYDHAGRK